MLYQKINFSDFKTAFDKMGRGDQFSEHGLKMLYDWLDEVYSDDDVELDVIAICCGYTEYDTEGFLMAYDLDDFGDYDSLDDALNDGAIDCVIAYDLAKDVILLHDD